MIKFSYQKILATYKLFLLEYPEYAEQLEQLDEIEEEQSEPDEIDMREARLVMQVELLSHLLRTVSTEILQIPTKPVKNTIDHSNLNVTESAECHYGKNVILYDGVTAHLNLFL